MYTHIPTLFTHGDIVRKTKRDVEIKVSMFICGHVA